MHTIAGMVLKRIALGALTIVMISFLISIGIEALPGDVAQAILGQTATPETVAAFRRELKLDLPFYVRYFSWLQDFSRGDFGISLANGRPVAQMIGWRFSNTLFLAAVAGVISVPLSLLLGMLSALYRNSWFDRMISTITLTTISFPEFFVAYILIAVLSVRINLFPSMSNLNASMPFWQKLHIIILPCLTLTRRVCSYDAHDPGGYHQCPEQSLHRDGRTKGFKAQSNHRSSCVSERPVADHYCDRSEPGLAHCWRGGH